LVLNSGSAIGTLSFGSSGTLAALTMNPSIALTNGAASPLTLR